MTGAPRPIFLRLLLLPMVSAQPECSPENVPSHITFPLDTFSAELPFSARKKYEALASMPLVSQELAPGASQISSSATLPGGHPATEAWFLFSASGPSHWPSPEQSAHTYVIQVSGNCTTSEKPCLIKRALPSL